ncbi:MFS general substrate transporter [Hyaloscypha bicolor E]|uniref:MFS general substrate transporter n=1 Tax=Hyaloscypha bicolor E TaxID=1095630 RepID=A0A2J6SJQ9_9HELO|nr:MFS general substrate transporter [Hyaloscypha bicolor E]PMD51012.1 MFS general substrate transporter [Hyaloscypha bicolor E]
MTNFFTETKTNEVIELSSTSSEVENLSLERALLWKLDYHILPLLYLAYIITFIDRANIGNVKIEGMLTDLDMKGNDYNIALIVYAVPFILLELPSSLALRRYRPGNYIAFIMFGWGVATLGAGITRSYAGLLVCRFLVGCFEAGLIPSCTFLMNQYYKKFEFQRRYSFFFTSSHIGGAFSGLLTYALVKMNNIGGYAGWRWVFIIEGLFTILLAITSFFLIVPLPEDVTFLTPSEKTLLLKRLEGDHLTATSEDKTPLTLSQIIKIMTHWKIVLPLLACFACNIATSATTAFQPTVLKNLGFTSSSAQIHTIPVYMSGLFFCLLFGFASDLTRIRYPYVLFGSAITLVGWTLELAAVKHIDVSTGLGWPHQRYAGIFLLLIGFSIELPILIVWAGSNLKGRKERVVGFATLIGGSQLGNLVSANVFIAKQEKCGFKTGMATGVGVGCLGVLAVSVFFGGLWWENGGLEKRESDGGDGTGDERGFRNVF